MSDRPTPSLDGPLLGRLVRSLQDHAILMLDRGGRITSWNVPGPDFKEWRLEDVVGVEHAIFYPPDTPAGRPARDLADAVAYGRQEENGWRVRRDGGRFRANVVITPVRDADGEVVAFGEVIRDITDQHAAIEALRRSEARFRGVTESASDAILSVSASGIITGWNPAAARLYGYSAIQAIGLPVVRLSPEALRDDVRGLLSAVQAGDREFCEVYETVARLADGSEIPVEVSLGLWEVGGERSFSAIVRDVSGRKASEAALQHLADHDPLTGLINRRRFEEELAKVASECQRYERGGALLVIDLDGFKEVNDRHGHSAGDEVIAKVGALLREIVRESDVISRLGGDEFGVIIQETDRAGAEIVADKIIRSMRDRGVVISDLVRASVTASVGITLMSEDADVSADELLVQADRAMYEAKALGRNRWAVHRPDPRGIGALRERHSWVQRLRDALEHDSFELLAQPIVAMGARDLPRYELLLRLRGADGELIGPSAFLDNAERFDLIGNIDRWVLARAVALLHAHHAAGHEMCLAVNLSGKTMNDATIVQDLQALMREHPVPPGRLIVEVTETAAIVNIERAAVLAAGLRELGCHFALDDFGSGFASFHYLKHLTFDYLKIDGEFISGLVRTPTDQLVVRAVVDVARGLGTETIAEFIEDAPTLDLLHELGVDHGQGYHLGRPQPLTERLPDLLAV